MGAGRGRLGKIAAIALLTLAHAAPAGALSCVHFPFQRPGERFGTRELVAHVEVLEVRDDRTMDVRVLRVFHGLEGRPVISVDTRWALGWNMPQQWGFEPFNRGTQWVIVMLPGDGGPAPWQPQLCRAFLKVEGGSAVGYVSDLSRRERVPLDTLAARIASPQAPAGPTTSR
jgi:hypothetical protein